jgi:NADPH-dependent curcumin reductase CurA
VAEGTSRQWVLKSRPVGMVEEGNFELREEKVPQPKEGEFVVRVLLISLDPAMRGWIMDRASYIPPVQIGEVMRAGAIGEVVESRNPEFQPGDLVQGMFGWQERAVVGGPGLMPATKLPPGADPLQTMSVLGMTGLTAYFGLLDLGRPKAGETVLVSGAAGATGSIAGQIAKIRDCTVVGIAGGAEKCGWLTKEAHFDAAIDYKSEDVGRRIGELCPRGVDVYFDNVGGPILEAALAHIAQRARIVLCGGISAYNDEEPPPGPRNLMNLVIQRARMEGFIVVDYLPRFGEALAELSKWVAEGRIAYQVDVQKGIENAPKTFLRLFTGANRGKQVLELGDPSR